MVNIKDFDSSLLKLDKKSYENIKNIIRKNQMESISDHKNINSVNPLYLIIGEVDGYIEESNGNKYLTFASPDKNREVLTKYTKLWDKIKYLIETINDDKAGEYDKDFMKIKVN